jgi:hypothetical protein
VLDVASVTRGESPTWVFTGHVSLSEGYVTIMPVCLHGDDTVKHGMSDQVSWGLIRSACLSHMCRLELVSLDSMACNDMIGVHTMLPTLPTEIQPRSS